MRTTAHFQNMVLLAALCLPYGSASALVLNFESLADSEAVTNQFAGSGIMFQNATALKAGFSLNEAELPPKSGENVVIDEGGPMIILFSPGVFDVGGYFTYGLPITLSAFDGSDNLLGSISSAFASNLATTGDAGSTPNEFLELTFAQAIARLTITGDAGGGSFVLDDLTIAQAVPEPSALALLGLGIIGLLGTNASKRWRARYDASGIATVA